jgi:hypothetical protein
MWGYWGLLVRFWSLRNAQVPKVNLRWPHYPHSKGRLEVASQLEFIPDNVSLHTLDIRHIYLCPTSGHSERNQSFSSTQLVASGVDKKGTHVLVVFRTISRLTLATATLSLVPFGPLAMVDMLGT